MKWYIVLPAVLVSVVALVALVGALLPRHHEATRAADFARPPAALYAVIRDFAAQPTWRRGLKRVELLPAREGRVSYREESRHGAITYVVLEDRPGERLVVKIADENLPFGGTWTFLFAAAADGTRLEITEHGEVKNVIFRFLARFVFGHTKTIDDFLADLARKVGGPVSAM